MSELDLVTALLHDYAARHEHIKAVYERYKHLDAVLSDPVRLIDKWRDEAGLVLHHVIYDCWQAICKAMEDRP